MKKLLLIGLVVCVALTACQSSSVSPKDFQRDVEDILRYRIALMNVMIQDYSEMANQNMIEEALSDMTIALTGKSVQEMKMEAYNDSIRGFTTEIDEVGNAIVASEDYYLENMFKEEDRIGYREVLRFLSNDSSNKYSALASRVLDEFNKTLVLLSEYTEVETSSNYRLWNVSELNTDIKCQVVYNLESKEWDCRPDATSVERYMTKHVK